MGFLVEGFQSEEDSRVRDTIIAQVVMGLGPTKVMWCYRDETDLCVDPFQDNRGSPRDKEFDQQHSCYRKYGHLDEPHGWRPVPFYTTSLEDAWAVVEKLACEHFLPDFRLFRSQSVWEAHFVGVGPDGSLEGVGEGDTPAYAICEAALQLTELQSLERLAT